MRKRMLKVICNSILLIIISICLIAWGFYRETIEFYSDYVNCTIGLASIVVATISVFLIIVQLKIERKLQAAEFIVNLNQSFVNNIDYAKVYSELESCDQGKKVPHLARIDVSNYLTFFETIYLLVEEKVIDMKILDDLFAYRFFLAVHNKEVQKTKLVSAPYNFRNIYYLEKIWTDYRKKNNLIVYREEDCLFNACTRAGKKEIYINIMDNMEKRKTIWEKIRILCLESVRRKK